VLAWLLLSCRDDAAVPCGGDPCCSEGWQVALARGDTVVVSGDGWVERPGGPRTEVLLTLEQGLAAAAERGATTIALAKGRYAENPVLDDAVAGLAIQGQCREEVVLDGSTRGRQPTVQVEAEDDAAFALADLTVTGGRKGIEVLGGTLVGERLDVLENLNVGVHAKGPSDDAGFCFAEETPAAGGVVLVDSRIAGTRALSDDDAGGVGLAALCGLTAELRGVGSRTTRSPGWSCPTRSSASGRPPCSRTSRSEGRSRTRWRSTFPPVSSSTTARGSNGTGVSSRTWCTTAWAS